MKIRANQLGASLLAGAIACALPSTAVAACASPTAEAGSMNWNGTAMVVCDGTSWSSLGASQWVDGTSGAISYSGGNVGIGTTSPVATLDVAGNIVASGTVTGAAPTTSTHLATKAYVDSVAAGIPSGAVMAFNLSTCPSGWTALAGATGRMIVGVGSNGTNTYTLAQSGGSDSFTLTTAQLPSHTHSVDPPITTTSADAAHTHSINPPSTATTSDGAHTHNYYYWNGGVSGGSTAMISGSPGAGGIPTSSGGTHTHSVDISSFTSGSAAGQTHTVDVASFTSGSTGSGSSIDRRPAFLALLYCQKD